MDDDDLGGCLDLAARWALWIMGIVIVLHFAWKYW